ncbi:MAG: hypothetical protein A3H96_03070 [Acidobacteria bacterium RIFCSPLOWO2_02_FULL_67_36]|nr:MAG: hypothetical protein A3H96_03070 [Acidobacteria bacterium RIFCSPLOWO2_02_FULL_67_36]OFW25193.1 MAG: hypothetical protein A3G21_09150 [Acidobacteria bacterium RIFCSPLOWO2_12_FULL_66_21]
MLIRRRLQIVIVATLLMGGPAWIAGQAAAPANPQTAPLNEIIPVDPRITTGRFANGLRYYIRRNSVPVNRAELRLVVNAGSILEEDDQVGLAHFVEHMAFNGTKHFPKQDIVTFMESIGMRFGPSVNAFTSFDETVYMLQVPADKPAVLDRAFLILEDWAQDVSFDPVEIDKERGVITEEWRLRRGAAARIQEAQLPVLLKGSRYAERIPIGKMDVVQHFKPERLTKFYADWYRPELMAVVAVGDFDPAAIEALVKTHFGSIAPTAVPRLRPTYKVPPQPGTLYSIATDKEIPGTSIAVFAKGPARDQAAVGDYRRQIVERLFSGMLNARFSELAQKPDPPFLGGGTGRSNLVRTAEMSALTAAVKENGVERGLEALFSEAERVARFGFTATELDREKRDNARAFERAIAEQRNQQSGALAAEYIRNFLQGEPIPGLAYENALVQRFLPEITLAEVNALATDWLPRDNRVVLLTAPQKDGLVLPDEAKLAAVIASAAAKELKAYVDSSDTEPLIGTLPAPGTVAKTKAKDGFGITEWELSNGVKVVLKPTAIKDDEILFRATSPGGTSLVSDQDWVPASTAVQAIAGGGLGRFSNIELRKALTGKVATVRPTIGLLEEGLSGSAARKDLETMFQLIHLTFTAPRADPSYFGVITSAMKTGLANQKASPEYAFAATLQSTLTQNHLRARLPTAETIDQMNLEKSFAFYKDRFADASDFTFVFVGSFDLETIEPLVKRYLATLPSTGRRETWKDVGIRPPRGVVAKRVEKGLEPKSRAAVVFTGEFKDDLMQRIAARAMADVLQTRLRERLREELGGTYSVTVATILSRRPAQEYSVGIEFGCSPDRTDELVKGVFKEIEALKASGPTEKQVSDVKEAMLRDQESSEKQNTYWLGQIVQRYQYGEDLDTLFKMAEYYRKIDASKIQDAARKYLNTSNYVKVALFPEAKQEARSGAGRR